MRNHDIPTYHQMLKLGLSLGVLHVLCAPALAKSEATEFTEQESQQEAKRTSEALRIEETHPSLETQYLPKRSSLPSVASPKFSEDRRSAKPNEPSRLRESDRNIPTQDHQRQLSLSALSDHSEAAKTNRQETQSSSPKTPTSERLTSDNIDSTHPILTLSELETSHLLLEWQTVEPISTNTWFNPVSAERTTPVPVIPTPALEHVPEFTQTDTELSSTSLELTSATSETNGLERKVVTENIEDIRPTVVEVSTYSESAKHRTERLTALKEGIQNRSQENESAIRQSQSSSFAQRATALSSSETTQREESLEQESSEIARASVLKETPNLELSSPRKRSHNLLSELLESNGVESEEYPVLDDELGTLRLIQLRSRDNEDLGILRILQTAQAAQTAPSPPPPPIAYLGGRLGFVDVDNVFRTVDRIEDQVYQAGLSFYLAPKISENTSFYAIAETNVARYNNVSQINYNELQLQLGVRQKLFPRTFAQVGWRNQRLYSPGYRDKLFDFHYLDALVSHRRILSPKTWVDGFYQMRLGFADPEASSRFRQTFTVAFNYGISRNLRTSLLYQLDLDDYTQVDRYDTYQQLLGIISYNITPESRLSVFGGTRFGRSSEANINIDDTFYGAGLNVNVPLF